VAPYQQTSLPPRMWVKICRPPPLPFAVIHLDPSPPSLLRLHNPREAPLLGWLPGLPETLGNGGPSQPPQRLQIWTLRLPNYPPWVSVTLAHSTFCSARLGWSQALRTTSGAMRTVLAYLAAEYSLADTPWRMARSSLQVWFYTSLFPAQYCLPSSKEPWVAYSTRLCHCDQTHLFVQGILA
jgi:hypothetical protein